MHWTGASHWAVRRRDLRVRLTVTEKALAAQARAKKRHATTGFPREWVRHHGRSGPARGPLGGRSGPARTAMGGESQRPNTTSCRPTSGRSTAGDAWRRPAQLQFPRDPHRRPQTQKTTRDANRRLQMPAHAYRRSETLKTRTDALRRPKTLGTSGEAHKGGRRTDHHVIYTVISINISARCPRAETKLRKERRPRYCIWAMTIRTRYAPRAHFNVLKNYHSYSLSLCKFIITKPLTLSHMSL